MSALTEYAAVRVWMGSVGFGEEDARLALLEVFCAAVERNPDEIIGECLRVVDDGRLKLRLKARRRWVEEIDAFEDGPGGRARGNIIRSFFIHNGVPIQPGILLS